MAVSYREGQVLKIRIGANKRGKRKILDCETSDARHPDTSFSILITRILIARCLRRLTWFGRVARREGINRRVPLRSATRRAQFVARKYRFYRQTIKQDRTSPTSAAEQTAIAIKTESKCGKCAAHPMRSQKQNCGSAALRPSRQSQRGTLSQAAIFETPIHYQQAKTTGFENQFGSAQGLFEISGMNPQNFAKVYPRSRHGEGVEAVSEIDQAGHFAFLCSTGHK